VKSNEIKCKTKFNNFSNDGFVIAFSAVIATDLNFISGTSMEYRDDNNKDNENLSLSVVSGKIHIYDNWTATKAAGKCTGNGTYSDPYVIEDLVIDGGGSGIGIYIQFSIEYFTVENCTIYNSENGINLNFAHNGTIIGNNLTNNNDGIDISDCKNSTISGNNVSNNNNNGIILYYGSNNTISGNTANNNIGLGIYLWETDGNIVSGNTISNNTSEGISIMNCTLHLISGNTINKNAFGIYAISINNFTISENDVNENYGDSAIWIDESKDNEISKNKINFNTGAGINLAWSNNSVISGNNISYNNAGIVLQSSDSNVVSGNNASYNEGGIGLEGGSNNNTVLGNTANHNGDAGLSLEGNNNTISGNTVSYNNYSGISVNGGNNSVFTENTANYNTEHGLSLAGDYYTVSENMANHNDQFGIMINGDFNNISENIAKYNGENGITLDVNSDNCTLFLNDITGNIVYNGYDDGTNNQWDNGTIGHYWEDYSGKDADDDGIGDTLYTIPGNASSQDNYPIWWDAPVFSVNSPTPNAYFSINPPNFEISIDEGVVNLTWYTLDSGIVNKSFTGLINTIDQVIWDSLSDGTVTVTFYVNDSLGYLASAGVNIEKDTEAPIIIINSPSTDVIFGNNAPEYNLTVIELNLHSMWYTLDGGLTNNTFTGLIGTINQTIWDSISEGNVTVGFYVRDSAGHISFEEVEVRKQIPKAPGIPGYNIFFLFGILSVVAIIISIKLKKFN